MLLYVFWICHVYIHLLSSPLSIVQWWIMHHTSLSCILLLHFEFWVHLFVRVAAASRHTIWERLHVSEFVGGVYRKSAICVLQSWSDSIFGTVVLYDFLSPTLILFSFHFSSIIFGSLNSTTWQVQALLSNHPCRKKYCRLKTSTEELSLRSY